MELKLNERLSNVQASLDADVLTFVGALVLGVDDIIRTVLEDMVRRPDHCSRLAVILTTFGGYIEVVHRIVDTLRHHYKHVSFVVPNYAFSAGTVLVMSGDEIYMDYYSRLGPIDPQLETTRGLSLIHSDAADD
jgi:ClpP class serine protease